LESSRGVEEMMDENAVKVVVKLGVTIITVPIGFLLYRVMAYFWNNTAYIERHGSDPEEVESEVIQILKDRRIL